MSTEGRFWSNVQRDAADRCWLWTGYRHPKTGYGQLTVDGRRLRAHRAALEEAMGVPIPDGKHALHTCDVPACVRNDGIGTYEVNGVLFPRWGHLWLGMDADNRADCVAKGRQARGDRNGARLHPERLARGSRNGSRLHPESRPRGPSSWSRLHPERLARGERNGNAKLTAAQVLEIMSAIGSESLSSIARTYCVNPTTIQRIRNGRNWQSLAVAS